MTEIRQEVAAHFEDAEQQHDAAHLGMWTFLATEVLLFGGLLLAYTVLRMQHAEAFAEGSSHLDRVLGTVNTIVLLASSLFMALADSAVHANRKKHLLLYLGIVIVLGCAFLGIKFYEYHHAWNTGHVPVFSWVYDGSHPESIQLFYFLYFAMTGLHAVHMTGGIATLTVLAFLVTTDRVGAHRPLPVEMTGLYWHFVDLVWIFLFPLLYLIGAGHY